MQRNATVFLDALNDGLHVLGNDEIVLKEEQYEKDLFGSFAHMFR